MSWTTPTTATGSLVVSPGFWNGQIPFNFVETDQATAEAPGDLVYADAQNSMGNRVAVGEAGSQLTSDGSLLTYRKAFTVVGDPEYVSRLDPFLAGGSPNTFQPFGEGNWVGTGPGGGVQVLMSGVTGTRAIVKFGARYVLAETIGVNVQLSYGISGATTVAPSNTWGTADESDPAGTIRGAFRAHLVTGLTPGTNIFTLYALTSNNAATARIGRPWLIVKPL